ncbi:MAG: NADP-dependent oxidoreductase [SAR86 cluster bacterium]|jgi:NADPH-dependent curcumin reductase CurA|nr:NADP-dependent oxidoreductase [SAR86 cluster bacterium]
MSTLEKKNRFWVMKDRPSGHNFSDVLELLEESNLEVPVGCFATKNLYISMDAGTRMYMTDREDSYQPPIPIGEKLMGTVLSEVIESNHPDFIVGEKLRSYGQWADFSVVDPSAMYPSKVDDSKIDIVNYVGIFGANGWTAYTGVIDTGRVKAGDTFVVSAAAGCTGLMAGQIAKISGCKVIGIAGSDDKCNLIIDEYGFDGAINYKKEDISAELKSLCPEGVNVYFDNVAGSTLDAVLENMANFGVIAVCGLMENYGSTERLPGPYNYDLILMKRLRFEGFFSPDFYHRESEINPILERWNDQGLLKLPIEITEGLENLVEAYSKLFQGTNIGKVALKV